MKSAELIIDNSGKNVDLYYATRFLAYDNFMYFRINGRKYLLMSDLEIDRSKKESVADTVLSLSKYTEKAKRKKKDATAVDALIEALKEKKVKKLIVPRSTSFAIVDYLRKKGFKVKEGAHPFYPARIIKSKKEIKYIEDGQKAVFSAMKLAETMIKKSKIKNNKLYLGGKPLTSERVQDAIRNLLFEKGYINDDGPVVAGGDDGIDPHCRGYGVLRPHQAIVVDIFPKSMKNLYWSDATRTFCKGKASPELKKMYDTVKTAQEKAIKMVRHNASGKKIHEWIVKYFERQGYPTGEKDGRMQGFIHGTGHGIGLEIHEEPVRIKPLDYKMKDGIVTSVEPGLYYKGIGGIRIEDLVLVTKNGCRVLSKYPKKLEI